MDLWKNSKHVLSFVERAEKTQSSNEALGLVNGGRGIYATLIMVTFHRRRSY